MTASARALCLRFGAEPGPEVGPLDARWLDDYLALWAEKVAAQRGRPPMPDEEDWES